MAWPTQYLTGPNVEQILSEIFAIDVIDAGLDARLQKGELLTPQEIEKLFGTDMWEPYRLMHAKLAGMSAKEPDVSMQYHSFFVALYLELLGRHTGLAIPRDAVKAAMLHDIYEDVGLTVEGALRERDGVGNAFGAGVAETVWHLTNSFALALNAMPDYVLNFPAETSWVKNPGTLRDRFLASLKEGRKSSPREGRAAYEQLASAVEGFDFSQLPAEPQRVGISSDPVTWSRKGSVKDYFRIVAERLYAQSIADFTIAHGRNGDGNFASVAALKDFDKLQSYRWPPTAYREVRQMIEKGETQTRHNRDVVDAWIAENLKALKGMPNSGLAIDALAVARMAWLCNYAAAVHAAYDLAHSRPETTYAPFREYTSQAKALVHSRIGPLEKRIIENLENRPNIRDGQVN